MHLVCQVAIEMTSDGLLAIADALLMSLCNREPKFQLELSSGSFVINHEFLTCHRADRGIAIVLTIVRFHP